MVMPTSTVIDFSGWSQITSTALFGIDWLLPTILTLLIVIVISRKVNEWTTISLVLVIVLKNIGLNYSTELNDYFFIALTGILGIMFALQFVTSQALVNSLSSITKATSKGIKHRYNVNKGLELSYGKQKELREMNKRSTLIKDMFKLGDLKEWNPKSPLLKDAENTNMTLNNILKKRKLKPTYHIDDEKERWVNDNIIRR